MTFMSCARCGPAGRRARPYPRPGQAASDGLRAATRTGPSAPARRDVSAGARDGSRAWRARLGPALAGSRSSRFVSRSTVRRRLSTAARPGHASAASPSAAPTGSRVDLDLQRSWSARRCPSSLITLGPLGDQTPLVQQLAQVDLGPRLEHAFERADVDRLDLHPEDVHEATLGHPAMDRDLPALEAEALVAGAAPSGPSCRDPRSCPGPSRCRDRRACACGAPSGGLSVCSVVPIVRSPTPPARSSTRCCTLRIIPRIAVGVLEAPRVLLSLSQPQPPDGALLGVRDGRSVLRTSVTLSLMRHGFSYNPLGERLARRVMPRLSATCSRERSCLSATMVAWMTLSGLLVPMHF